MVTNYPGGPDHLQESFEDFFEYTNTGFLITDPAGIIIKANGRIGEWLHVPAQDITGNRFSEFLPVGGKMYYETHLFPLLRMQGHFDEVLLDLVAAKGEKMKVIVNGYERRNEKGDPLFVRLIIVKANDRYVYEQNLKYQKADAEKSLLQEKELALLREQFIAVLGHDLRNPLASVTMGASLLQKNLQTFTEAKIAATILHSAHRMEELISNVMDFARTRMGDGIGLQLQRLNIASVLEQLIGELQIAYPGRTIEMHWAKEIQISCDPARLSQLVSNLLANALTHGDKKHPIRIHAAVTDHVFALSVSNSGQPIPPDAMDKLFHPFTREGTLPSKEGLGLGLYIASEIARAHKGSVQVISNNEHTVFTFTMPV